MESYLFRPSAPPVVRDPLDYCPGCNTAFGCTCPPPEHEDAAREASYRLGLEHGTADGPENRPTQRWLVDAGLDPEEYLAGYDAGCAWPQETVQEPARAYSAAVTPRADRIPEPDASASRIASEAAGWLAYAAGRSRMKPETLLAKALGSVGFSVQAGASGFAVPSKLVSVSGNQRRLWTLVRDGYDRYERLEVDTVTVEGVRVTRGDEVLGEVQAKHVPWVRPLLAFGLTVHLSRVTGHETDGHTLGVNVVFGGVGRAVAALAQAQAEALAGQSAGDGHTAPGGLRLVVPVGRVPAETVRAKTETSKTGLSQIGPDIVLWRDARGTAHASLGQAGVSSPRLPHVVRHSPSGLEWGYGGSGPSDLALSVLTATVGRDEAERHYRAFVAHVVSRVPHPGAVLPAERVCAWVRRQNAAPSTATAGRLAGRIAA